MTTENTRGEVYTTAEGIAFTRDPNIVVIPGTSKVAHLRENLAAADLELPADALAELEGIAA